MKIHEEFSKKYIQGDTKGNAKMLYELVASNPNAIPHYGIANGQPCEMYRLSPHEPMAHAVCLQVAKELDGSYNISIQGLYGVVEGASNYIRYNDPAQQESFITHLELF